VLHPADTCARLPCAAGTAKTIEFPFNVTEDTAEAIASEMMEDLSLSREEASIIATKIKEVRGAGRQAGGAA
jgi:hypothetical protein